MNKCSLIILEKKKAFRGQIKSKNIADSKKIAYFKVKNDYEMKLRERIQWMVEHVSRRHSVVDCSNFWSII